MDLRLLIVVVLIRTLILFFHIWYIIRISLFCSERKMHLGMMSTHYQLGLGLKGYPGWGGVGMRLLILLLTGMGANQLASTRVCVGDRK